MATKKVVRTFVHPDGKREIFHFNPPRGRTSPQTRFNPWNPGSLEPKGDGYARPITIRKKM